MGSLTSLQSLHLRNNSLLGEVPSSIKNCRELLTVDFGNIPSCVNNPSAMVSRNNSDETSKGSFFEDILVVMKGRVVEYSNTLKLVKTVDLSDNNLSGEIPKEVTSLAGLQSLNFSHNLLVGRIPDNIGAMRITGKIPTSTQLQNLDATSFLGTELFGPPLSENSNAVTFSSSAGEKEEGRHDADWSYLSIELGFWFGLLGALVPVLFCKSWRFLGAALCIMNGRRQNTRSIQQIDIGMATNLDKRVKYEPQHDAATNTTLME
ncbi:Leucine-rich repeat - like 10 [Theobroma cacao]|nr:Leucine-rich repeat - like 10 [Theobroma cacao]